MTDAVVDDVAEFVSVCAADVGMDAVSDAVSGRCVS